MHRSALTWLVSVLVVAAGGTAAWWYWQNHRPPPVTYETTPVARRHVVGRITATGTLLATVTVTVGTQVSGRVAQLMADYNSSVKKGQIIAKIDPQLFQAALEQSRANYGAAQATLKSARAQADLAAKQLIREEALLKQSLAAQQDVDTAQSNAAVTAAQVDVAAASVAQTQAQLHQAQTNLSYTDIVSPIDGTVISRNVDVGQTVAASLQAPVLFTIAEDLTKMQVNTNVSEGDVGRLAEGMPAYFSVDAYPGERFRGKISQIRNSATTVSNVVTYDAVIDVDNADLRLRPGMTANVTVTYADKKDVLTVPNAALRFRPPPESNAQGPVSPQRRGATADAGSAEGAVPTPDREVRSPGARGAGARGTDGKAVWTLSGKNPVQVPLETGLSDGAYTEVLSDETRGVAGVARLKEGDAVIVDAVVAGKDANPAAATQVPRRSPF